MTRLASLCVRKQGVIPTPELTGAELRVLKLLAEGMQSKEIASAIGRRKPTIEGYIRILCIKLNAKSRVHLVARAYQMDLIDADESA